ncbi:F-box/kelch-repeat protein [Raphanus sativus]|uniref:F-box/kelch-repeat protein At4g38940 n=1 Tax=Raphanus sativus TaxID=3726 RepID=A0A9W3CB09_RAPSA|nr:F-box/kelch-repeat protein At4g38940 [Raphanus sativus]KAJ4880330.1 F-box/kelch-repeat protein [Raphanus sativus]
MEQSPKQSQSPLIPSLPDDVTVDIVARVPRSRYPTLSLVSRTFRKLIASPKLYNTRSQLGITEHRVYALLYNRTTGDLRFHVLHRKVNCRNRLVVVGSLPPMSSIESFVSVGSKTYVFNNLESLSIDFASHTVQSIPGMPQRMINNVANAVDGKVYLIGDSFCSFSSRKGWMKAVMVFDTETQTWEPVRVKHDLPYGDLWSDSAVMEGKLFFKSFRNHHAFAYEPREDKWELKEVLNAKEWKGACVVDDVLYYHDRSVKAGALMAFDPKQSPCWSVVNGLEEFFAVEETDRSRVVKCGEKMLALFFTKKHDAKKKVICCAEIALGRRQGEIWGKVLSCDVVFEDGLFDMVKCVSVTV